MESLPITLIVKAPNQQIEDQQIKCELSWTINKLKQHLSEVYPSKPPKHEQKLIYSGQLLSDSLVLKDVLRQYDGQDTHTVHLVCATKYSKLNIPKPVSNPNTQTNMDGGNVQDNTREQRVPDMPWTNINGPTMTPMDANQYAMHLAWMQQAYVQYMTQYMQLAANSYQADPQNINIQPQPVGVPNVQPDQNQGNQPAPAAPQPAPPAGAQRDPENADRDWLDMFYMLSRAMVLFSVIYFYSSPVRFVLVLFLGLGLYLYQIGFFRTINNNNNNNMNGPPEPAVQEEQVPSRLMVFWTFFTTFFASLIPEIPNAV